MLTDRQDLEMTAAHADIVTRYEQLVDDLLRCRPSVWGAADALLAEDPGMPLARVARAYLSVLDTDAARAAQARDWFLPWVTATDISAFPPRERAHIDAASRLLDGDLTGAALVLRKLSTSWPRDPLALIAGHQIDLIVGDRTALRDRIGGALSAWRPGEHRYGPLLGMYALGLAEAGREERAAEVARDAVDRDPVSVRAIHAMANVHDLRARFGDGIRFLDSQRAHWADDNLLYGHLSWHYCLFLLEAGAVPAALARYDAVLGAAPGARQPGGAADTGDGLRDATSLLWRLRLAEADPPDRWPDLATAWAARTAAPHRALDDVHAGMAFVAAGHPDPLDELIAARRAYVEDPARTGQTNQRVTRRVGLPVLRALAALGAGRYAQAVDLMYPLRYRLRELGGGRAQRDALQKTLIEAALRAGRLDEAATLLSERTCLRPGSRYNWLRQAALAEKIGDTAAAAIARDGAAAQLKESGIAEGPGPVA